MKIKCSVCKTKFRAEKEKKYISSESKGPFSFLVNGESYYDSFDCPKCGCQNRVEERYSTYKLSEEHATIEESNDNEGFDE